MDCPYCGAKMEKGLLQTGGNNIIWDTKVHALLVIPSNQGVTLAYRPAGAYIENVFHCRKCKKILFQYEGEEL